MIDNEFYEDVAYELNENFDIGIPKFGDNKFFVSNYNVDSDHIYDKNGVLHRCKTLEEIYEMKDYFPSKIDAVKWILQNKDIFASSLGERKEEFMERF